ncbi:MAG TPA: hypothetical protein VMS17_13380 [Gemmataceae bacterium]|nr:hypothetical protein [Gemmataceae bacterium]
MTVAPHSSIYRLGSRINRCGPWALVIVGVALMGAAAYERWQAAACENNIALAPLHYGHVVRMWQFGGSGTAAAAAGLLWVWLLGRLRTAKPQDATLGRRAALGVVALLLSAAAAGLFLFHLRTSNVDWEEAAPALGSWWLAALIGNGFALYLARPRRQALSVLIALLFVTIAATVALYANSTDVVGMFLGFGRSTAGEQWYLGLTAAVAGATAVLLWLAAPRANRNRSQT